jgi:hypothetical protein
MFSSGDCDKREPAKVQVLCRITGTKRLAGASKSNRIYQVKSLSSVSIRQPLLRRAAFLLLLALAAGCNRDSVKVYQVTEENAATATAAATPDAANAPVQNGNSAPQLQFTVPSGWQQIPPSQMRVASFSVTNTEGRTADIGVIPLPAAGEDESALVNMWREQVQLPDTTNVDFQTTLVGNDSAKLFEVVGTTPLAGEKFSKRILVVELTRGNMSWFFKMTGADSLVASQKDNFLQFLKSVSFTENAPASTAMTTAPADNANSAPDLNSMWTIPAGWQTQTHSSMLLAQFSIAGDNGAKADVNVLELAGEGGGLLKNLNRWRGQLNLPDATETDLATMVTTIDSANGKIELMDFSGTDKSGKSTRLVGAVVPQNGQTWFYKLMGDDKVVSAQKDAFIQFIRSAQYPK